MDDLKESGWRHKKVVAFVILGGLIAAFGYSCAIYTVDVVIYRVTAVQILNRDYNIYPAVADGGFRYAPITALIFVPLAWMPVAAGAAILFVLKTVCVFLGAAIILSLMRLDNSHYARACWLAFLAAGGYMVAEFRSGNVHFMVFSLLVIAILLVERGQTLLPACLLALAIVVKLTPALFLLYFAWKREWRLCIYSIVLVGLLLLLPAVLVGMDQNSILLHKFADSAMQRLDESRSQSLRAFLFRLLGFLPLGAVNSIWVGLTTGGVVAMALITGSKRRTPRSRVLEYCLIMTAILILSPHSLRIYFSTLFFPFIALAALMTEGASAAYRRWSGIVLGAGFLIGSFLPAVLPGREIARAYSALSPHFVLALGVSAVLALGIRLSDQQSAVSRQQEGNDSR